MRRRALLLFTIMLLLAGTLFNSGCTTTSPGTTTTTVMDSGCDSRAIAMSLPGTVNDYISTGTMAKTYCVNVPPHRPTLTITLSNLQDDLDLYIGYFDYSSIEGSNYDWHSENSGTTEDIKILHDPRPGNYYIQVYNVLDHSSSFRLQVA